LVTTITKTTTTLEGEEEKIDSVTKSCKPFINKMLKNLANKNAENANTICNYIIAEQTEFNIKDSTKIGKIIGKIKALVYLSRFCNDRNFKEMTKQGILDHLNTFRISTNDDKVSANNKWIGTYNFRQMIFNKFFRRLYYQDEPDPRQREKQNV
jgi:hypothetical protein